MIKNFSKNYNKLNTNTKLILRITMITFFCSIIGAMYSHTATHMDNYYRLLIISEDLLNVAKSTIGVGFLGTMIAGILEN